MHVCDHCDGGVDGDNDDGDAHDCGDDDDDSDDQHPRDNADCNALTVASLSHVAVRTGLVSLSLALWLTFLFAPCMSSDDQTYLERVHQLVLGLRWLEGELHKMTDCPIAISSVASIIADDAFRLEDNDSSGNDSSGNTSMSTLRDLKLNELRAQMILNQYEYRDVNENP